MIEQGVAAARNAVAQRFPNGVQVVDALNQYLVSVPEEVVVTRSPAAPSRTQPKQRPAAGASNNEENVRRMFPQVIF